LELPSTLICEYLFATTSYYFQHQTEMPACAGLVTFRDEVNARKIGLLPFQHRYFHLWQGFGYWKVLLVWFGCLLIFSFAPRHSRTDFRVIGFGSALTGAGLLLFGASCVLHDYEPRLGVSMWELTLLSSFLFAGRTADRMALPPTSPNRLS
jgi:hypothetical protein